MQVTYYPNVLYKADSVDGLHSFGRPWKCRVEKDENI
jgi:hypothetical protein